MKILEKKERLDWYYDEEADVVYLNLGKPRKAAGVDLGQGVVVRYGMLSGHLALRRARARRLALAFCGALDASRRGELVARLADTLGEDVGKILVLPVCEKDVAAKREFINEPMAEERADA